MWWFLSDKVPLSIAAKLLLSSSSWYGFQPDTNWHNSIKSNANLNLFIYLGITMSTAEVEQYFDQGPSYWNKNIVSIWYFYN